MMDVHSAVEQAARNSYGRLLAFLAARTRDVAAAEDAVADAFRAALETWPRDGVPQNPDAWLLVSARRRLIDAARHSRVHTEVLPELRIAARDAEALTGSGGEFPDERLKLLFVCAHPAIDAAVRTPLMLQIVLGMNAERIASAFLVSPTTMGQRLSRAKTKIRDAGIRFAVPERQELPDRLDSVLEAIYAAYGSGWDDVSGADPRRRGLSEEAIMLGRLMHNLLPGEPEASGLLALMLHCEARRPARRTEDGKYVSLANQDVELWSRDMIAEAESLLGSAFSAGRIGRFQLEAAIQSAHAHRLRSGYTDWRAIADLYDALTRIAPTTGALVNRSAAIGEAYGPCKGLEYLELVPQRSRENYQPYWALRAHLLAALGRAAEAITSYNRAIGLCEDPAMREFLIARVSRLQVTDITK